MYSKAAKLAYATSPKIEDGIVHRRDFSLEDGKKF